MDPAEALDLLFEDGASPSNDAAAMEDAVGEARADAVEARRGGRARQGPVVNLKHGRGPVPDDVRTTFRERSRQPTLDSLLEVIDGFLKPLDRSVAADLEVARRDIAALREQEVTPERLARRGDRRGLGG